MPSVPSVPSSYTGRPIITLTSDFGTSDFYFAAMKAVLLRACPEARLIDVTHGVPRHDILCGSITLERAVDGFPPGTTHLAVVDPGVGTSRRLLVALTRGARDRTVIVMTHDPIVLEHVDRVIDLDDLAAQNAHDLRGATA